MTDINFLSKEGLDRYDNKMKNYIGIELTKAEYDQLSEEEKNKGTYWITDYSSSGGSSNIELDKTLSIEGKAADAKAVGDAITVRYNSEGYLEVLVDGNWVQTELKPTVDTSDGYLYKDGVNYGEFAPYKGGIEGYYSPSDQTELINIIQNDNLTVQFNGTSAGAMAVGSAITKAYDLTNYNKLIFEYECSAKNSDEYNAIAVFITASKQLKMQPVAKKHLMSTGTFNTGTVELDISAITGEHYIGIFIESNINHVGPLSVTLINPRLE